MVLSAEQLAYELRIAEREVRMLRRILRIVHRSVPRSLSFALLTFALSLLEADIMALLSQLEALFVEN